jgi:hypothetical protein
MAPSIAKSIRATQLAWATRRGVTIDKDSYCLNLEDNLFQPLSACSRADFEEGDGAELGQAGKRGKLQALHSSSALACNVFDYWRGRDLGPIGQALGIQDRPCSLRLEGRFRTGLRGTPPNLDVVFAGIKGSITGVESKFTEAYSPSKSRNQFKDKYFPGESSLWGQLRGLPSAQALAERLHARQLTFTYLEAGQLLKHSLGLAATGTNWNLIYLWYDPGGEEAKAHAGEVATFIDSLGQDSRHFSAITYQEFFTRLRTLLSPDHEDYCAYLAERYFHDQAVQ